MIAEKFVWHVARVAWKTTVICVRIAGCLAQNAIIIVPCVIMAALTAKYARNATKICTAKCVGPASVATIHLAKTMIALLSARIARKTMRSVMNADYAPTV